MNHALLKRCLGVLTSFLNPTNKSINNFRKNVPEQTKFAGFVLCQLLFLAAFASAQTLLDPTFDGDGKVTTQIVSSSSKAYDSILQPDGKIVAVGSANANPAFPQSFQIAVARYNGDGSLDTTFDGDEKLTTTINSNKSSEALAAALQTDGKIVVAGRMGDSTNNDAVVVRYNADGSLDTTFDTDGIKTIVLDGLAFSGIASDIKIQSDGKIVLVIGLQGFIVCRLNSDGTFDNGFGTGGAARTALGVPTDSPKLAFQSDGRIVVTARTDNYHSLARYNTDGSLDNNFGASGIQTNAGGLSIAVQPDNKIVTATFGSQPNGFLINRYNANGSVDTNFGTNGATKVSFTGGSFGNNDTPYDLAIQPDGKIVAVGKVWLSSGSNINFGVTRLNSSGSVDSLFGFNGQLTTDIQGADIAHAVFIQPDGKIVAAGESGGGFTLTRYIPATLNNACRPVSDFDGDGKSDLAFFDNGGNWNVTRSSNNSFFTFKWGIGADRLVPADYNGDCRTDFAVYRDGVWYVQVNGGGQIYYQFGLSSDIPAPGDFDGDDLADAAVYRNGVWYVNGTRDGFFAVQFGLPDDKPVVGDYDGDGKDDIAVYRPSNGVWYLLQSNLGFGAVQFGLATDKPAVGDFDGDGKTDIAVYRPSDGTWYLLQSTLGFAAVRWGISTDLPVAADYDGDGKTDIAVYRGGDWYLLQSNAGYQLKQFGGASDRPIQNAFVP